MADYSINSDYYRIGVTNFTADAYGKNGIFRLGGFSRTQYCWEILCYPNLSSIPSSEEIIDVEIIVSLSESFGSTGNINLRAYGQNHVDWSDNGTSTPAWETFSSKSSWDELLSGISVSGSAEGEQTIPSSNDLVDWMQKHQDGTYPDDDNKGVIITGYTNFNGWFAEIDSITFEIETESTKKRRLMLIT